MMGWFQSLCIFTVYMRHFPQIGAKWISSIVFSICLSNYSLRIAYKKFTCLKEQCIVKCEEGSKKRFMIWSALTTYLILMIKKYTCSILRWHFEKNRKCKENGRWQIINKLLVINLIILSFSLIEWRKYIFWC